MAARHRYGDQGTEATASEKVVATLFIVGLVALLVPHHRLASDEYPPTVAQPDVATPPTVAIVARSSDTHDPVTGPRDGPAANASVRAVAAPPAAPGNR